MKFAGVQFPDPLLAALRDGRLVVFEIALHKPDRTAPCRGQAPHRLPDRPHGDESTQPFSSGGGLFPVPPGVVSGTAFFAVPNNPSKSTLIH